jgi:hypothetical protein
MIWQRVCGWDKRDCRHYLAAVAGCGGVAAVASCGAPLLPCSGRTGREVAILGVIGGAPVVAGALVRHLRATPARHLYDVLPCVLPGEWELLLTFARDYTARGIPWAAVVRGVNYCMIKRKVV